MNFSIYVKPSAIKELQNWLKEKPKEPSAWLEYHVKLVTPQTPGWVVINISADQWWNMYDWFGKLSVNP